MQHLLEKNGFVRCGIIHLANGAPRIAYQFAGDSTNYRGSNEQSQQNYDPQTPDQSWSVREVPSGGRGFGIASMVLGIISLVLFFSFVNIPLAILAIIFGIIQLTRKAPKGMAISGIVMGISSLFLLVIFWTCMFVSAARTESTDNSTYYYEGSENDVERICIGEKNGCRSVPRLHHRCVILVKIFFLLGHEAVVRPRLRN